MKKLIFLSLFLSAVVISGCLKDKGFENNKYGINDPDDSPIGVGFPLASKSANIVGIEVRSTPQIISTEPVLVLYSGQPATSDIRITLSLNPGLLSAYNTANSTNILPMPSNLYSFSTLNVVLPAGQSKVTVPLTISNSTSLDPTKAYGVGVSIASVEGSYKIAQNFRDLLLVFNIKNKYDGIYLLSGFHNRPTLDAPYKNEIVHLVTTGPNKVKMYWPGAGRDAHPINGATTYYSNFTTEFQFAVSNATMNPLVAVDNPYTPGSPPFTVGPAVNSRWSDTTIGGTATKVIYAQYYYNANLQRMFTDTLVYQGPR
jgi:hypothetical protein